ncbi:MAG: serine/threonine protein kinase, partial [Planctomycetes bacterium]|nr:serine/threonine protein kinase [Planctomycetota bacterium]
MHVSDLSDLSVEPSALGQLTAEQKARLTDVLDRYLSALESGVPPDREDLLEEHGDLAGPLALYLDSLDELHYVAAGFGGPSPQPQPETPQSEEKRLGDFRLLREIGRGGMGVVYEARQISLGRRVALKVLPFAAVLDSKQIARFKNEAQAAAQLDHPNIVSVFAVGADRGVHYYAMRYIDGQPLDRAIAELRGSEWPAADTASEPVVGGPEAADDTRPGDACSTGGGSYLVSKSTSRHERFRTAAQLGIQAAEALHAAHEYGVVHRDVKPSNLLLDGDGKLWVTDFGLARCQTDVSLTKTGDVVGTMRYMSPEQASGQSALVDHRTDVYSLGITLYELITLQPAFPDEDGRALMRRIDQDEPRRLRQLEPSVPADLETVILKAMAKDREERYATAQEFADDLGRVLEGKPTNARPPTLPDRLGKWARRHKRIVVAVAAVCLAAVVGMAVSTLLVTQQKIKADRNKDLAQAYFRKAQDVVYQFGSEMAEELADVPGADRIRGELLRETLGYYRDFVKEAKENPSLRADLAMTYSKIGTLTDGIGSTEEAIDAHRNAVGIFRQLVADEPDVADHRCRLALCQNNLALVLSRSGRTDEACAAYRDAIRLQEELAQGWDDGQRFLGDLALSYSNLGLLQSATGAVEDAEASFREAIRLQERLLEDEPDDPDHLEDLAASVNNLSGLYADEQPERAADLYERALSYQRRVVDARPGELKSQRNVALTYNNLGAVESRTNEFQKAAASYAKAIELQRELVRAAPAQKSYRCDLAVSLSNLGLTQSKLRRPSSAERSFEEARELQELLVGQNPRDIDLQGTLGGICNNLGIVQEELGRIEDAAESYKKAAEHQRVAYLHAPQVER